MTAGGAEQGAGDLAERLVRTIAVAAAVVLALAAFAGMLPGTSIFLGLLASDPPRDIARTVGALLLAATVLLGTAGTVRRALAVVGAATSAMAVVTAWTGTAGGAEIAAAAAFAAVVLAGSRVSARVRAAD